MASRRPRAHDLCNVPLSWKQELQGSGYRGLLPAALEGTSWSGPILRNPKHMNSTKMCPSKDRSPRALALCALLAVIHLHAQDLPLLRAEAPTGKYTDWGTRPEAPEDGPPDPWTWPDWDCGGPEEDGLRASSTLPPQGKASYGAAHICDDDPTTAWVEGRPDDGIGEYIEINDWILGDGTINILNGYQASRSSWENNGRVKRMQVSHDGKPVCVVELADVMGVQTFQLPGDVLQAIQGEVRVRSIADVPEGASYIDDGNGNITYSIKGGGVLRFTILEVYAGLKWKDTAISGIFGCRRSW